ncbi:MAG: hypothetical protein NTW61_06565 [Candidatus Melainabacteria bacterium]|nr:hypothetical protein [Candidatus Melainabacteria bacterium]
MPSSLFRRATASSAPTKTILLVTLLACLFVASSWNLMSFSKIKIRFGGNHSNLSASVGSDTAVDPAASGKPASGDLAINNTAPVTMSSDQALQTIGNAVASGGASASEKLSTIQTIEAGIREIASAGVDPFSIALVNPIKELKKTELQKLTPFYQLLITQNKDIKVTEPPPPPKPKEDPTVFNPSAGGVAVETIPVVPNPMEGIQLAGVSYMPKRSFAMLNVSGQSQAAIVTEGEVLSVGGQSVKVVAIRRGKVQLSWLGAPKGIVPSKQLTMPDIIGYKAASSSSADSGNGGAVPAEGAGTSPPSSGAPEDGANSPSFGGAGGNRGPNRGATTATPPANSPEAIEKLVKEAMKP